MSTLVANTPLNVSGTGPHTINVPSGNYILNYTLYGGGGGGGQGTISSGSVIGGGGGGAGAIVSSIPSGDTYITPAQSFSVVGPMTVTVTVGAGGVGGTGNANYGGNGFYDGQDGSTTSIVVNGSTVSAPGGHGGKNSYSSGTGGLAGGGSNTTYNGANGLYAQTSGIGGDGGPTSGSIPYGKGGDGGTGYAYAQNASNGGAVLLLTSTIPPTINSVTAGNGSLVVNFTPSTEPNQTNHVVKILNGSTVVGTQTFATPTSPQSATFNGLTNGVTYTAEVTVNAASGSGSVTLTQTPNGPPAAPAISSINNTTANTLVVNFTPSTSPTPSYVTNYTVSLTAAGQTVPSQTVTASPATFAGLVAGVNYTAIVTANYSGGTVPSVSSSKYATGNALPVTVNTPIVVNDQQMTVSFNASATPYAQLGNYVITLTPTTGSPITFPITPTSASSFSHVFTGLTNYMQYTVKVETQGNGTNVSSTSVISTNTPTATPTGPPAAPTSVSASSAAGSNAIVVTFPASATNSAYVGGYTVSLTSTTPNVPAITPVSGTNTTVTFSNLIAGASYTASVVTNGTGIAAGLNSTSVSSSSTIVKGAASPVTITATPGNGSITVNFSPSATPASELGNYQVGLTPTTGSPIIQNISPGSTVISGLTNYMNYDVSVKTVGNNVNVNNTPVISNVVSVTPQGPPAAAVITNPINTSTANTLVVNFTASATPSSALASYIVSLTAPGFPAVTPQTVTTSGPYTTTFSNLVNGVTYSAIVTAVPSAAGIASTPSAAVSGTPTGPLAHPTNIVATGSNNQLSVAFTAINPVGTIYTATATATGYPTVSNTSISSPIILAGLANLVPYTVTVVATHSNSLLTQSTPPNGTPTILGIPTGPPTPATNVTISNPVNGNELVVIWTQSSTPQIALNNYVVSLTSSNGGPPQTASIAPSASTATFSGLIAGSIYTATVTTTAGIYTVPSTSSLPVTVTGTPAPPTNIVVTPGNSALTVSFSPSASPLTYIDHYEITTSPTLSPPIIQLVPANGVVSSLPPYTVFLPNIPTAPYTITVKAVSLGTPSFNSSTTSPSVTPFIAPPNVSALAGGGSIQLSLNDPFNTPNTVEYWVIVTYDDPENPGTPIFVPNLSPYPYGTTSIPITDLSNGTEYSVTVYAKQLSPPGDESTSFDTLITPLSLKTAHCYARGTLIATSRGMVPIEDLMMSDKLRTYDRIEENIFKPVHGVPVKTLTRVKDMRFKNRFGDIKFIGKFTVNFMHEKTAPIRITAESLGPSRPERDLLVSPNHAMLVGDRLIFAKNLVNGSTIYQDMSFKKIEYFHVLSDDHYIINANGALSETLGSEEISLFESLHSFPMYIETPTNPNTKYNFKVVSKKEEEYVDLIQFKPIPNYTFTELAF